MNIEFVATEKLTEHQKVGMQKLRAVVYPPEVMATLPGRLFTWSSLQWSVLVWDEDELVSKASLLVRDISHDNALKRIGGIGGVMTHPAKQGLGLASQAMREASRLFDKELNVSYALLFCHPHLVEFYRKLNWKPFEGKVFVEQPNGKVEFSANGAMVLDVKEEAPSDGVLDLNGLPW